ncbi:MAG: hypothetical protein HYV40_02200, partial [Candidatus Levybacteria bacterium]|nr:hypothetical protein [Candidatus Levybacteria bacterium]
TNAAFGGIAGGGAVAILEYAEPQEDKRATRRELIVGFPQKLTEGTVAGALCTTATTLMMGLWGQIDTHIIQPKIRKISSEEVLFDLHKEAETSMAQKKIIDNKKYSIIDYLPSRTV